ncbi:MAG TPA: SDR family NAD(P)-dependent oxidoreductase [Verrucomicrobiae bacterium]|jgi:3-hydroxybutyrate dehydrogenase|nr:SDR family NAD(P)-dependent oxidoreductase [Verrucomicrobiae bacterium]
MREIAGKTALVTGGGKGIGKAIALAFAAHGSRIVITGRNRETLEATAEEMRRGGAAVLAVACDVSRRPEVAELKREITGRFGGIEILVNNAGVAPAAAFLDMEDKLWDETMAVNVNGVYNCCKAFLPAMVASRWGRIINVGSTVCRVAYPNISAYVTSKHALLGLTRALAVETARFGVTVNAVCPGYVDTGLTQHNAQKLAAARGITDDQALDFFKQSSPQKRLIDPDEIATLAVMLAGDGARGITGQAIQIDGGTVMA